MQVAHELNQRPCTAICCNDGAAVRAAKGVFWMVAYSPGEEATVKIEEVYRRQLDGEARKPGNSLVSRNASTMCRCNVNMGVSGNPPTLESELPKPTTCRMGGTGNARILRSSYACMSKDLTGLDGSTNLEDGSVGWRSGTKRLIMHNTHTFRGESVFP